MESQYIYKLTEINDSIINNLKFTSPELKESYYFIECINNFLIQINDLTFIDTFYRYYEKMFVNVNFTGNQLFKDILFDIDNKCIKEVSENFKTWFNKEISVEDLLEYYIPSVSIWDKSNKDNKDESENNGNDDSGNDDSGNDDSGNDDSGNDEINEIDYAMLEVPYEWEENDLDIIIYDSENNEIANWESLNLDNKKSMCILKLKGLNIEKKKFYCVWEIIQLKLL